MAVGVGSVELGVVGGVADPYTRKVAESLNMNDIVHAAVRRDLTRMESALRSFRAGDDDRARGLQRAWSSLWGQLHHHHVGEDTYVFPYVRSLGPDVLDPALLDAMEAEHRGMSQAIQGATTAIDALAADPTAANAQAAADAVAHAYEVTDGHLVHEESDVVPVITAREETPEWKAVEKHLRKGGPKHTGELLAWLQDGAEPRIQQALAGIVPAPVRFVMSTVFGRRYHREVAPVWR